jgi:hypothetical protein
MVLQQGLKEEHMRSSTRIFLDVLQTASVVALAISLSTLYWSEVRSLTVTS